MGMGMGTAMMIADLSVLRVIAARLRRAFSDWAVQA
jgi:hypothetical protein